MFIEQTIIKKEFPAKAQRRKAEARKEQAAFNHFACFLCATSAFAEILSSLLYL
jgi:hypothetical protein